MSAPEVSASLPTLLLLPGMDGTGELFDRLVAALHPGVKVIVVRYPTQQPLGYEALVSLARAALPSNGPYAILGESFSGPVAISLAADTSPRLKGLILGCSFARNPRPALSGLRSWIRYLPVGWAPTGVLSQLLLGRFSTPALRSMLAQAMARVTAPTLRTRLRAVLEVDVTARLAQVRVPVLYLRATHDRLVPAVASALIAGLRPDTEIVDVEAPHFLLQSAADEAASVIQAFLQNVA